MSLDMLLSTKSQRQKQANSTTAKPDSSSSSSSSSSTSTLSASQQTTPTFTSSLLKPSPPTALYLESLSSTFLTAINTRDFPTFTTMCDLYFDADMTSHIDDLCFASNHAEYMHKTSLLMHSSPRISAHAKNVRADVDEEMGTATVFISFEITGWEQERVRLKRSSVGMMRWRRREGRWRCFCSVTLRGMGMFEGEGA